jgi:1-acyl-sn-glycerol-3-phosphate acyltransferase
MAAPRPLRLPVDLLVTLAAWIYFVGAAPLFLLPGYVVALFTGRTRVAVQRLHHWYCRGFFALVTALTPGLRRRVDPAIRDVRGAVVVCNHVSYLDPLLLIALLPRHSTFVKPVFFRVPVFGWCLAAAGYVPAGGEGLDERLVRRVERLRRHLAEGGNLFVFPEGRRGRTGSVGPFHKGAFRLAKRFGVPLELLYLENTDRLFERGRFLFHTCTPNEITVARLGRIDTAAGEASPTALVEEVRGRYVAHAGRAGV